MNTTVKSVVALIGWLRQIWMPSFMLEIASMRKWISVRVYWTGFTRYFKIHKINPVNPGKSCKSCLRLPRDFESDDETSGRTIQHLEPRRGAVESGKSRLCVCQPQSLAATR